MSSEGLVNLDYLSRYETLLSRHLPDGFQQFSDFFAGTARLKTCAALLSEHLDPAHQRILNVGCGPFATEIFVDGLQGREVLAVDYTPEFAPFFDIFRQDGHLATTTFRQTDIMAETYPPARFDVMIMHDLFYEKALDMGAVLDRLTPALAPGGLVMIDFVNARTRWLWRLFGRADRFRRYDPDAVRAVLDRHQLEVLDWRPHCGASRWLVQGAHRALRLTTGEANNYALIARKTGTAPA